MPVTDSGPIATNATQPDPTELVEDEPYQAVGRAERRIAPVVFVAVQLGVLFVVVLFWAGLQSATVATALGIWWLVASIWGMRQLLTDNPYASLLAPVSVVAAYFAYVIAFLLLN